MPHPLESGTIRILKPDGSTAGTGFLVSKRLAVTCAHVVESASAKPGDKIQFEYHLGDMDVQEAWALEDGWSSENDVAVLELTEKPPKWIRPIIMQSSQAMEGRAFQGLGYPDDGPVQTRWPQGNLSGRVDVEGYANPLLQIQGKEIDRGLSGSAVVDRTTRRVIGMISAYQDVDRQSTAENVRFGYAIPIETIWKVYPELEKGLPPLPKRSPLVEGIHLLPNGYDFRIQNFLNEYLGTPEQPEPFGGREDALRQLDAWLDGDIQRLLVAAPAGRGKSALLVRWLDHLIAREDLGLVFVPVSVRFRTNLASTCFASLAARLAYLHNEDVPTSDTISTDVWRGLTDTYLTKSLTDDKKLLIVLDGLDEAGDWEASADLIPAELPKNVRIVVSARYLAGDSNGDPWLSRLGWEHTGKASTIDLDPLDSSGVSDVLFRMGVPLDNLSKRVDVVSELHRLSEGDPLLVNLYVEDLWSRGEKVSRIQPDDLRSIKPGYEGYFDHWWADQKKLWGKEAPLREKNVRLVFNLLCGAMGGLTKDDLIALDLENELNTYSIEEAIDSFKRFVIGIPDERQGKEIGYILSHPKLQDYFWNKLAEKEQMKLETRFIAWGESTLHALIDKKLNPVDTPSYLILYYGAHLERTHVQVEFFFPFVDYPYWHQAWFVYEGSYGGYRNDVNRTWKACKSFDNNQIESSGKSIQLSKQIRCALIISSLHTDAANIPPEMLAQLVRHKIWTLSQTLAHIRQIPNNWGRRAESLSAIAHWLDASHLDDAIRIARQTESLDMRVMTLVALSEHKPELPSEALHAIIEFQSFITQERFVTQISPETWIALIEKLPCELLEKAFRVVTASTDRYDLPAILIPLIMKLPSEFLDEVLQCARTIRNAEKRAEVLIALAERNSGLFSEALQAIGEALQAIGEAQQTKGLISFGSSIPKALISLIKKLPPEFLDEVLQNARKFQRANERADVLIALAERNSDLFGEALQATREIRIENRMPKVLISLIKILPPEFLDEALQDARKIRGDYERAEVLIALAERDSALFNEALQLVREIRSETGLIALADYNPYLFSEALQIARTMDREYNQTHALIALIKKLPPELLDEALQDARKIQFIYGRAEALIALAERDSALFDEALQTVKGAPADGRIRTKLLITLAKLVHPKHLGEILTSLREIRDEERKANLLILLSRQQPQLFDNAVQAAKEIQPERGRARVLALLIEKSPREMLADITDVARQLQSDEERVRVWIALTKRQPGFLNQTLEEIREMRNYRRPNYLVELAELHPFLCKEALTFIDNMDDADHAIHLLTKLSSIMPPELIDDALTIVRRTQYVDRRADFIVALVEHNLELFGEALHAVKEIQDENYRTRALARLVEKLPVELLGKALKVARGFRNPNNLVDVWISVLRRTPSEFLGNSLPSIRNIRDAARQADALATVAGKLPPELFDEALQITREIQIEWSRIIAFTELTKKLPVKSFNKALQISREFDDKDIKADALVKLVAFDPDLFDEALLTIREMRDENKRAILLSKLATIRPIELLGEAMDAAGHLIALDQTNNLPEREDDERAIVLRNLKSGLLQLSHSKQIIIFEESLLLWAEYRRGDIFSGIEAFADNIINIGEKNIVQEIAKAIEDVTAWWP